MLLRLITLWLVLFAAAPWLAHAESPRLAPPPAVAVSALPPEAAKTLALIRAGGPYPYSRDGIIFHNRERRLPPQVKGYYREYTVPTPGLKHRGAKRIIAGSNGEFYYSPDHYRSFMSIRR